MRITFGDGKYGVENNNGILTAFRHGEAWPGKTADLVGDKFALCLVQRIEDLEKELAELKGAAPAAVSVFEHEHGIEANIWASRDIAFLHLANLAIDWCHELAAKDASEVVKAYREGEYRDAATMYRLLQKKPENMVVYDVGGESPPVPYTDEQIAELVPNL